VLGWLGRLNSLFTAEKRITAILEAQAKEIHGLKDRVTKLEAREEILIARAQAAATASTADLARRIGALEERTRGLSRLSPPDED
jgi:hypothetical protein